MVHDEIKLRNLFSGYYKEKTSTNKASTKKDSCFRGRRKRTSELLKELLSQEQRTREEQEDEYNPHWISDIA